MRKLTSVTTVTALAAALTFTSAAYADGNPDGKFQFKLLATSVMPGGSVSSVPNDGAQLVSHGLVTQTEANNNVTPTIAIEYFVRPSISLETIAGVSAHHITASAGALAGTVLVDHALVVPATLTLKYHFLGLPGGIKPYVGVGPTLFLWIADRPSAGMQGLGVTRTKLSSNVGGALQAGIDLPVGHGYGLSLDAKKYFVKTDAHFYTSTADIEDVKLNLNPWVVSAGVSYRF
jgi:outer membrane protein